MSLINDMLRELDRRGVEAPALPSVSLAAPAPRPRLHLIVVLVALSLAVFAAWLVYLRLVPAAPTTPEPSARPASIDIVAEAPDPSPQPDAAPSSTAAAPGVAAVTGNARHEVAAPAAAPADVPVNVPVNVPAGRDSASPTTAVVPAATDSGQTAPPAAASSPAQVAESARPTPTPRTAVPPPAAATARPTVDPTRPMSAAADSPVVSEPVQRLSIQRHGDPAAMAPPDLAGLLQQANAALAAGRDDEALRLLQQVLDRAPTQHQARLSLAALHADQGRVDEAIALLEAGLVLAPQQAALAERLGRLRLLQGEPARAAAILAQALPPLADQPSHHALLALAWQQAGQPAPAARIYQSLLQHDERVGPWWLGLAMARDALGERAAARNAFAQALRAGGLDDGVLRYVRQRMAEIEANSP